MNNIYRIFSLLIVLFILLSSTPIAATQEQPRVTTTSPPAPPGLRLAPPVSLEREEVTYAPLYTGCGGVIAPPVNLGYEQEVVELVNAVRADNGLPPLKRVTSLDDAARYHAADMGQDDYFDHDTYDRVSGQLTITTTSPDVSLYIYGTWNQVRLRNDDGGWTGWQPFQSAMTWMLNSIRGERTVWAEVDDGSQTAIISDSIYLDISIPPASLSISGPLASPIQVVNTFTARVRPITATQPITYVWQATDLAPVTHTGGLSDTASFMWATPGSKVITVTVTNITGTVRAIHLITTYVPLSRVAIDGPTAGLTNIAYAFTAVAGPVTATQPVTYVWRATGLEGLLSQAPVTHTGGLSDTVVFTWAVTGPQVITVTVVNAANAIAGMHAIFISTSPEPPARLDITGPTEGVINTNYTFAATVGPVTTTQPITYLWRAGGQLPMTHTGRFLNDTVSFTWNAMGTYTVTVTATNVSGSAVTGTHVLTISPPSIVSLSYVTVSGPITGFVGSGYTFTTVVGFPLTGTVALPITYTWQAANQPVLTNTVDSLSNTAIFTWSVAGPQIITVTATSAESTVTDTHLITLSIPFAVPLSSLRISGPSEGLVNIAYTFTATVEPATAAMPITYVWRATGNSLGRHIGGTSDAIVFTWGAPGDQIITVTATNARGIIITDTTGFVVRLHTIYLPLILKRWPPIPYKPNLAPISNEDGDGSYTLGWTGQLATYYTVQEARDGAFTLDVHDSTTTAQSYAVTDKLAGTYYYRVRGHNEWGQGEWSDVQSVTVLLPETPVLDTVENADGDGNYTISWSTTGARTTRYILEEDDNANFSTPITVHAGPGQSVSISDQPAGSYYYRVRAEGPTGWSDWSNSQFVFVGPSEVVPNDPFYADQWGLPKLNAPQAWARSTGTGVIIAIVDTGVDLNHPDLAAKIVQGYDFVNSDNTPQDDNGHGSHAAGIAAAMTNNGIGVAGLGWNAQVMPIKALDDKGAGYASDVAEGVRWAVNNGAKVINLSLGGENHSSTLEGATTYAYSNGTLVVAAAGNCGDPSTYRYNGCSSHNPPIYPAANPDVLAVGSTTSSDTRSSFSEYGWFVDVAAPGSSIYSTLWDDDYGYKQGTSQAAPLAAGLASLVWARNSSLTNGQVADIIKNTVVDLGSTGWDEEYGYGRIDAAAAVVAAASATAISNAVEEPAPPTVASVPPPADAPVRPGVVLVRFKTGISRHYADADYQDVLAGLGLRITGQIEGIGVLKVSVPVGREHEIAAQLTTDPGVEFAEPDYRVYLIQ